MSPIELLEDAFTGHLCNGQAGRVSDEDVAAVHLHYSLPYLCLFCSFFFSHSASLALSVICCFKLVITTTTRKPWGR